jgi:hypothetical protein
MSDDCQKKHWREERQMHWREKRRQTLAAFFEQQRTAHGFINLMDLADWCACSTTTAGVDQQKDARELAYKLLAESMLSGEFEQGRPHVRFLHPEMSRWRLNREAIRIALRPYDAGRDGLVRLAAAEDQFWRFCWLPSELARKWLESRGYRWAPHFDASKEKPALPRGAYRKGRTPQPVWKAVRAEAMKWLEQNGYPESGDGGQADLERRIADLLAQRDYRPAESTIRSHVAKWIDEFRAKLA